MAFGGNTHDLGSFGEETDKITDLHQIHEEVLFTERRDGVAGIKRCRRDLSSNGVRDLATMSLLGNTRDLSSFGEETNKIIDLHQIHEEVLFIERGDEVAGIKRRRRDLSSDGVRDPATASGRGRLKEDLESST
nr:hypothetical protein [Tanacetum cinerariifolium]